MRKSPEYRINNDQGAGPAPGSHDHPVDQPFTPEADGDATLGRAVGSIVPDPSTVAPEPQREPANVPELSAPTPDAADESGEARLESIEDGRGEYHNEARLPIWQNSRWAVTDVGLESRTRAGPQQNIVEYVIEPERLLRVESGTEGVSSWAVQLSRKTWLDDLDPMLDAIENALRIHHPGQTAIDMAATRAEARRVWERSRQRAPDAGDLGHDYLDDAEARLAAYRRRR